MHVIYGVSALVTLLRSTSALSAGPLTRRPRPWRRRILSAAGDNEVQRPKRFRKLIVPGAAGVLAAVELSSSLWDIGHHHGLAMLSLSRPVR